MYVAQPIEWIDDGVVILDQRRLPTEEVHHTFRDYREVARAIREMVIRGAPAIGVAAAMGVALGVQNSRAATVEALRGEFAEICETLAQTRPTAVDLFWALERMKRRFTALLTEKIVSNGTFSDAVSAGQWSRKQSKSTPKRRPPTKPLGAMAQHFYRLKVRS